VSVRVAVLGGSAVATPQLAAAIEGDTTLVLIGRSPGKLERVAAAARHTAGPRVEVTATTDVEAGLEGAEFVVNQMRAGGLEARAFDETFPHTLGLPGEETMGPGGFANAWRTLPVVQELFETCARVAPQARLLNLTNPAGMVHQVAVQTGLDVVTFCDSPVTLSRGAAAVAGVDEPQLRYVGTNHGGWLTSLRDAGGDDHLPRALADDTFVEGLGFDPGFVRRIRALPNVYLRYVYAPGRELAAQRAKGRSRAEELLELEREALDAYGAGDTEAMAVRRRAVWYTECIAPALAAFADGRAITTICGVTNGELVPWLPRATMLEVPVRLDAAGAAPLGEFDELASDSRALLAANAAYEALAVEALLGGDHEDRVRAMAACPMVSSLELAERAVAAIEA
jgi:6-phospho-beta-glucosidase